ncbi:MAG TPA: 4-hydroxyphenylacetate 3-hydroxylase N-terminal domain-containing protein [Candidatus Binataceae bacterium]|nr:4-hydroxyphenylacetate 3-hydroxylase N-terminal domain-containing protein [Candidatus Binataceae bacterium]
MRTGQDYVDNLARLKSRVFVAGEAVENPAAHPLFQSTINAWGKWLCDAAFEPELRGLMTAKSELTGGDVHIFWHMPADTAGLLQNFDAAIKLSERVPITGYTSIARDELAGLLSVLPEVDRKYETDYTARLKRYLRVFQQRQLIGSAAITDVKGDRNLRPAEQSDRDMYLRVVERRKDGIVVRGAKAHTSGGVICEELVVIAQRAMREDDRDYAVAFAIPVDTPGITLVARGINLPPDPEQAPLSHAGAVIESLTIFDDVFVPLERVFLCGESEFCGAIANNFATINRHGYLGTDYGKLELFIGAAALIAEYNGVADKPHIRDKIAEMIKLASAIYALGVAAAIKNTTINGVAFPDTVMTNAGKHLTMEAHYTCARLLSEVAGGAAVTMPSVKDLRHPAVAPYVEKYFKAAPGVAVADRIKLFHFIGDMCSSEYAGWWYNEIIHGSGSPAAERVQMYREFDLDSTKRMVKALIS